MTGNLKGGAPGADGKNLLVSVGRGRFQLRKASAYNESGITPKLQSRNPPVANTTESPNTENALRDLLLAALIGASRLDGLRMIPEGKLTYELPNGQSLDHASDILVTDPKSDRMVSIELKYQSAVTDQFKCRAYDAMHMKSQFGERLLTIMVFARNGRGIGLKRAEAICHPFDSFVGVESRDLLSSSSIGVLAEKIAEHVCQKTPPSNGA